jgi:hypothetical protein
MYNNISRHKEKSVALVNRVASGNKPLVSNILVHYHLPPPIHRGHLTDFFIAGSKNSTYKYNLFMREAAHEN